MAMQSQLRLQLNLYPHRDYDNLIIQRLGLANSPNPNATVREVLYSLATNDTAALSSNSNESSLINEIRELKSQIEKLTIERDIYKNMSTSPNANNSKVIKEQDTPENTQSKLNSKLLSSIKNMDI